MPAVGRVSGEDSPPRNAGSSTSSIDSMPHCCVSRRCWASIWSEKVIRGKWGPSKGGGVVLGEVDRPLLSWFGTTMKYRSGSQARPGPIDHSLASCHALNQVGCTITLDRSAFRVPYVL